MPSPNPNWIPFVPIIQGLASQEANITAFNVVGNVALFVPLGAALVWRFGLDLRRVLAIALVASVVVEAIQYTSGIGRSVDINDVVLNTAGGVIGAVCMSWVLSRAPDLKVVPAPPRRDMRSSQQP